MKTQEPHQPLTDEDDEVTLVAPRFDDEETIVARRVVPLEEVGRDAPAFAAARARPNSRPPLETRRPWLLALVFVSSLVGGGVLGGAGFYFYQRSAAPRAAQQRAPTRRAATPTASAESSRDNRKDRRQTVGAGGRKKPCAPFLPPAPAVCLPSVSFLPSFHLKFPR